MRLADLMRKGSLRGFATATPATVATHEAGIAATVAEVATVAVATALDAKAANDPALDPDRWCWPQSSAMNTGEIETFRGRLVLFAVRGLRSDDADAIADKLVARDRDGDDRRLCLECSNLSVGAGKRCSAWRHAGIRSQAIPDGWPTRLQRCVAFAEVSEKVATPDPTLTQPSNEESR